MPRSTLAFALLLGSLPLLGCEDVMSSGDTGSGSADDSTTQAEPGTTQTASTGTESNGFETEPRMESSSTSGDDSETTGEGSSTGEAAQAYEWDLPEGFPVPRVPRDNPMSAAKVELGRYLFYDARLSANETQSCASCHRQELAFTDGVALPVGSTGDVVPRSSMALANVAYSATHTWANPLLESLSAQAAVPLFAEDPVELGSIFASEEILDRLAQDAKYVELFDEAYPDDDEQVSWINVRRAIASFERVLISGDAAYDRFARGDDGAVSEAAKRGGDLFFSERLECHHCHNGFNYTASTVHEGTVFDPAPFMNTGLYNIGGNGGYPEGGTGLAEFTLEPSDIGAFKPPSLRNIELTAPYMHDGSIATLSDVVDFYAAGGRNITEGPHAGDGRAHPNKSGFVTGFDLTPEERVDLIAFLESLTDDAFITDPRFSDPWLAE